MYTYEYEVINCDYSGWSFNGGNIYKTEDFRKIIDKRAKDGWRYIGFIPTKQKGAGFIQEMTLIFEKSL